MCESDPEQNVVIVVTASGQFRFSYRGDQKSGFSPHGLCVDVFGHILVCETIKKTVHLLNEESRFLSLNYYKSLNQRKLFSLSVCVDDEKDLYVGLSLKS